MESNDDPWNGMEFLDVDGDEDDLVRAALMSMAKRHVTSSGEWMEKNEG